MNNAIFDLSNSLYIQKQYLNDLSGYVLTGGNYVGDVAGNIHELENKLNDIHKLYASANVNTQSVIDHQTEVANIVNEETKRLQEKKAQVDNKMFEAKRMVQLNENYRKRQEVFNRMMIAIVLAFFVYVLAVLINRWFPFIPSAITNLIVIIVFVVVIIYIFNLYVSLNSRNSFDHDKLNLSPPVIDNTKTMTVTDANGKSVTIGNAIMSGGMSLFNSVNFTDCIGQACCSKYTVWDAGSKTCLLPNPDAKSPNTLIDMTKEALTYISPVNCTTGGKKVCGKTCIAKETNCGIQEGFEVMPPYSLYKIVYG